MNTNFLGFFTMGAAVGMSALLLGACTGKVTPTSSTPPALEAVTLSEISGPVVSCGGAYAHPNVCCEAHAGQASSCGVYPGAPFDACGSGYTTYPDPRSCCPLDASGDCVPPPTSTPPPAPSCTYACPPGQYEPADSPGTCCSSDGKATVCSVSSGSGPTPFPPVCSCPACLEGEACPPCDCGPTNPPPVCECPVCEGDGPCACECGPTPPPAPTCGACPPGWQVPQGEPQLCCDDSAGTIQCFSQGVPPSSTPVLVPGGPVTHPGTVVNPGGPVAK
jgi:hypothetical protein